jgi:phage-related protein
MAELPYRLDFFEAQDGDEPCLRWIKNLSKTKRRALGVAMEKMLQEQGVGVCDEKAWGKQLGGGIFEFRLMRKRGYETKPTGRKTIKVEQISLRVFCHAYGDRRILLLHGYDKGEDPKGRRQQREIEVARQRLRRWRARCRDGKRGS